MRGPDKASRDRGAALRDADNVSEDISVHEGCWNLKRKVLKGRQLRLPASFPRASSLPRRFARSVTPTPGKPINDAVDNPDEGSSKLQVVGAKKRAASISPSRNEFRRSLKERLPKQIRNLLEARGHVSRLPPKPSRKSGPVGRTWVKVYDDITFMDDSPDEQMPFMGHTGHAYKIPDASPLPRPPTPPPVRKVERRPSTTPSQVSEYDNVPLPQNGDVQDPDIQSPTRADDFDRELVLREIAERQRREAAEQELRPTARKRENTRFKKRFQKRSPTPVAPETDATVDESEGRSLNNETFENILYQHGQPDVKNIASDDDYIVPERSVSPPCRPKRGIKIYESVLIRGDVVSEKDEQLKATPAQLNGIDGDMSELPQTVQEQSIQDNTWSAVPERTEPVRPVRGIKIYESSPLTTKSDKSGAEGVSDLPVEEQRLMLQENGERRKLHTSDHETNLSTMDKTEPEVEICNIEFNKPSESVVPSEVEADTNPPLKPKRGTKVYENLVSSPCTESVKSDEAVATSDESGVTISNEANVVATPSKPCRGHKMYSSLQLKKQNNLLNKKETAPSYAQVVKSKDNQLKQVSLNVDVTPPPIPPKKKARTVASTGVTLLTEHHTVTELSPPKPQRHLKPRARSSEPVSRPKRRKTEAKIGDFSEYDDVNVASPPKPVRGCPLRATAPARLKKTPSAGETLVARMTVTPGKASELSVLQLSQDVDAYENVNLQNEVKVNFRHRPLPPVPSSVAVTESIPLSTGKETAKESPVECHSPVSVPLPAPTTISDSGNNEAELVADTASARGTSASTADALVLRGVELPSSADEDKRNSDLQRNIDSNLTNIQSSFATLDNVLQSLKSYSSTLSELESNGVEDNVGRAEHATDHVEISKCGVCIATEGDKMLSGVSDTTVQSLPVENGTDLSEDRQCEGLVAQLVVGTSSVTISNVALPVTTIPTTTSDACGTRQLFTATSSSLPDESSEALEVAGEVETFTDGVMTVHEEPESATVTSEMVTQGRRLAVGAKNVSAYVSEHVTDAEVSSPVTSDLVATASSRHESARKISVAAETVVLEFMPEATSVITDSSYQVMQESVSSKTVARKVSVGAENVIKFIPEQAENIIPRTDGNKADSPTAVCSETAVRKFSVAAETVGVEFVPESASKFESSEQVSETATFVTSDDCYPLSVVAVSLTVSKFADVVVNTSNQPTPSTAATVDAEIVVMPKATTVAEDTLSPDETVDSQTSVEGGASDDSAMAGDDESQTSIDSVQSVIEKVDYHADTLENYVPDVLPQASSSPISQEIDLKDSVANISSQLEGISSCFDSIVRNFSPIESVSQEDRPVTTPLSRNDEVSSVCACDSVGPSLSSEVFVVDCADFSSSTNQLNSDVEGSEVFEGHDALDDTLLQIGTSGAQADSSSFDVVCESNLDVTESRLVCDDTAKPVTNIFPTEVMDSADYACNSTFLPFSHVSFEETGSKVSTEEHSACSSSDVNESVERPGTDKDNVSGILNTVLRAPRTNEPDCVCLFIDGEWIRV